MPRLYFHPKSIVKPLIIAHRGASMYAPENTIAANPIRLWRAAQISRQIRRGLLYADTLPIYLRRAWLRPTVRPTALHPFYGMVTPEHVRWARIMGYAVNTWTVDDPIEMKRLIGVGVNAIITKKPDLLKQLATAA